MQWMYYTIGLPLKQILPHLQGWNLERFRIWRHPTNKGSLPHGKWWPLSLKGLQPPRLDLSPKGWEGILLEFGRQFIPNQKILRTCLCYTFLNCDTWTKKFTMLCTWSNPLLDINLNFSPWIEMNLLSWYWGDLWSSESYEKLVVGWSLGFSPSFI